ncbi:fas apoptotic inhibitory molecule 1 isoform X1 [Rhineura floridana]|uniref:fas apoptotic inhibitory molecule 1 isoform X1 n=1 Tax=Rhineura floridana TaxID=261503 RepID=UPI002AC8326C|nr:fas apoptotic inhibitory molecule 1 isoform X1 [Rhineura floridana]
MTSLVYFIRTHQSTGVEILACFPALLAYHHCPVAAPRSHYNYLDKMADLVAIWEVGLSDGVHKIEFEHGTTSGKRIVYVDGKEVMRKEWMFKLVGKETFTVGAAKTKATINIDAVSGFAYEYTLEINGKSLTKYMENRSKTTNTWVLHLDGTDFRVVLGVGVYSHLLRMLRFMASGGVE